MAYQVRFADELSKGALKIVVDKSVVDKCTDRWPSSFPILKTLRQPDHFLKHPIVISECSFIETLNKRNTIIEVN